MELKDFVSQTLLAISNGITDAQAAATNGFIIAPPLTESGNIQERKKGIIKPHSVHFNLKVVVEEGSMAGKDGGALTVRIASIEFSTHGSAKEQATSSSSQIQEISFEIPVVWPTNYVPDKSGALFPS